MRSPKVKITEKETEKVNYLEKAYGMYKNRNFEKAHTYAKLALQKCDKFLSASLLAIIQAEQNKNKSSLSYFEKAYNYGVKKGINLDTLIINWALFYM